MADQTVSLELTGDASDLIAAVQESGAAMEEMADAGTQAAAEVEQSMSGQESMWDRHAGAIQAAGASAAAAGASFEAMARSGQASTESVRRMSASLGTSEEEMREAAAGLNADFGEVVAMMETGRRQGIESSEQLAEYAEFWDKVGDATGESNEVLAASSVALRAVGIDAGREADALDAFGFITESTSGSVGEFLRFLERTGPELRDMGADVDDAAAIMGVLESEMGMSGRTARTEFRSAINESDGTLQGMLETLGVSQEQFAAYRGEVSESSDIIGRNAEITAESETALFRLQERIGNFIGVNGALVEGLSDLSPVLTGAGGAAWGFTQVRSAVKGLPDVISGVRTKMSGLTTFLTGPWGIAIAAATTGVGLFIKAKKEAAQRVQELRDTLDEETGALTENTEALAVNRLQQDGAIIAARDLGISMETLVGAALGVPGAMEDVDDAINEALAAPDSRFGAEESINTLSDSLPRLRSELEQAVGASREEAEAMAELEGRYVDVAHALDSGLNPAEAHHRIKMQESAAAAGESEEAVDAAGDAYEETAEQTMTAAEAIDEYIAANRRATDPVFRLMDAVGKVDEAQQAYNDTLDENGNTTDESAEAAINLMQRLGDLEAAALDGDVSFSEFEAQLARWVDEGRITETQAGLIRDRVGEARGEADKFEGTRNMVLNASGNAWDRIARINEQVAALPRNVQIRASGGMEFRADGGPVAPGQPYIVGEEGPELVTFGQRGMVHDAESTRQMLGPSAGVDTRLLEQLVRQVEQRSTAGLTVQQTFAGDVSRQTLAEARHQQRLAFLEAV